MAYCPAPASPLPESFDIPFEQSRAIQLAHNGAPRFGNTDDITTLVVGTREEQVEYIKGVVAGSIILLVFFVVWSVALFVCKICGPRKCGWLSGRRLVFPAPPFGRNYGDSDEYERALYSSHDSRQTGDKDGNLELALKTSHSFDSDESENGSKALWKQKYRRRIIQNRILKGVLLFSASSIIICETLMLKYGFPGLLRTVNHAKDSLGIARDLVVKGFELTDTSLQILGQLAAVSSEFLLNFNRRCPRICEIADLGICPLVDTIFEHLTVTGAKVLDLVEDARKVLVDAASMIENGAEALDQINRLFRLSSLFSVILLCICFCIVASVVVPLPLCLRRCAHCWLSPLFVVMVVVSFLFTLAFMIASTSFADLCIDSPDDRVLFILAEKRESLMNLQPNLVDYVIGKCRDPPQQTLQNWLVEGSNFFTDFEIELGGSPAELEQVCGVGKIAEWVTDTSIISEQLCTFSETAGDVYDFFKCSTWYPLYVALLYDTVCYSVDGFAWIAFTQFFIVLLALVVITCRVVIHQDIKIAESVAFIEEGADKSGQQPIAEQIWLEDDLSESTASESQMAAVAVGRRRSEEKTASFPNGTDSDKLATRAALVDAMSDDDTSSHDDDPALSKDRQDDKGMAAHSSEEVGTIGDTQNDEQGNTLKPILTGSRNKSEITSVDLERKSRKERDTLSAVSGNEHRLKETAEAGKKLQHRDETDVTVPSSRDCDIQMSTRGASSGIDAPGTKTTDQKYDKCKKNSEAIGGSIDSAKKTNLADTSFSSNEKEETDRSLSSNDPKPAERIGLGLPRNAARAKETMQDGTIPSMPDRELHYVVDTSMRSKQQEDENTELRAQNFDDVGTEATDQPGYDSQMGDKSQLLQMSSTDPVGMTTSLMSGDIPRESVSETQHGSTDDVASTNRQTPQDQSSLLSLMVPGWVASPGGGIGEGVVSWESPADRLVEVPKKEAKKDIGVDDATANHTPRTKEDFSEDDEAAPLEIRAPTNESTDEQPPGWMCWVNPLLGGEQPNSSDLLSLPTIVEGFLMQIPSIDSAPGIDGEKPSSGLTSQQPPEPQGPSVAEETSPASDAMQPS